MTGTMETTSPPYFVTPTYENEEFQLFTVIMNKNVSCKDVNYNRGGELNMLNNRKELSY